MQIRRLDLAALLGAALVAGSLPAVCVRASEPAVPAPARTAGQGSGAPWAAFYARATNEFAEADFFKPAERQDSELTFKLAPLLMQEVKPGPGTGPIPHDHFGALSLSNGVLVLDPARPAVYVSSDTVRLSGQDLLRFTYVWCYATEPVGPGDAGVGLQGVRLTLDSAGVPACWEVLADPSDAELIFVAQHVEAAALAEFGQPLPGRRYAIERAVAETPNVVVARVLEDGPVPMGPFVYLTAHSRSVSTLLCRCMPPQVKKLLHTRTYELSPSPSWLWTQARALTQSHTAFWPAEAASAQRLARCLRLPAKL